MFNRTTSLYPCREKVKFENFNISEDLLRYKNFLADQTKELKDVANQKLKQMNEFEENKHKCLEVIHNIIYWRELNMKEADTVPSKKEMSKLILAFHEREVRLQLVENLKIIGTPRLVVSLAGL